MKKIENRSISGEDIDKSMMTHKFIGSLIGLMRQMSRINDQL